MSDLKVRRPYRIVYQPRVQCATCDDVEGVSATNVDAMTAYLIDHDGHLPEPAEQES